LGCSWTLEQPATSLMHDHFRMKALKAVFSVQQQGAPSWHSAFLWMGAYGHRSPKATKVVGSHNCTSMLGRRLTRAALNRLAEGSKKNVTRDPLRQALGLSYVTGSDGLKGTQVYTRHYCSKATRITNAHNQSDSR